MPSSVVRADYDALKSLSQRFGQGASDAQQSLQRLRSQLDVLRGGDWEGKGANAFFAEMDGTVLPTLNRLVRALESAQRTTLQISQLMQAAEAEAAGYLNHTGNGEGPGANEGAGAAAAGETGGGDPGGTLGVAAGAALGAAVGGVLGGPLGALAGAALGSVAGEAIGQAVGGANGGGGAPAGGGGAAGNPLMVVDPSSLFSNSGLQRLIGSSPQGADSPALRSAMYELAGNPTGADLERVLRSVADARGVPFETIQAQHQKFLQVRSQAEQYRQAHNGEVIPGVNTTLHEAFMGSTPQLRFGQMVGEAFGMDPVFGAMLSPTGGMVGPGNGAFTPSNASAVGYHGVAHDAAGYLYNYHGAGPGYDYLGREGLDRGNPLTGQVSGMRYWVETIHPSTAWAFQVKDSAVEFTRAGIDSVGRLIDDVRIF